jgi:hypothetical protein
MSYLAAATRHLYEEVPDIVPLIVVSKALRVPEKEGMCHVTGCVRKAHDGEILCFDCIIRKDRQCLNFNICQSLNSGKSQYCKSCEKIIWRRCLNWSKCGNDKAQNKYWNTWYQTCNACYDEQEALKDQETYDQV